MKKILLVSEDPNRLNRLYSLAKQIHLEGRIATGSFSARMVLQANPDILCVVISEPITERKDVMINSIRCTNRELSVIYLFLHEGSSIPDIAESKVLTLYEHNHQALLSALSAFQ